MRERSDEHRPTRRSTQLHPHLSPNPKTQILIQKKQTGTTSQRSRNPRQQPRSRGPSRTATRRSLSAARNPARAPPSPTKTTQSRVFSQLESAERPHWSPRSFPTQRKLNEDVSPPDPVRALDPARDQLLQMRAKRWLDVAESMLLALGVRAPQATNGHMSGRDGRVL